jgi:hypothetical protein
MSPVRDEPHDLAKALEVRLLDAMMHVGFAVQRAEGNGDIQPDFILRGHDGRIFVGVLKVAKEPRSAVLEGNLAAALLTSRPLRAFFDLMLITNGTHSRRQEMRMAFFNSWKSSGTSKKQTLSYISVITSQRCSRSR